MHSRPYKQTFVTPWEESQPGPMEIDASPKMRSAAWGWLWLVLALLSAGDMALAVFLLAGGAL